MSDSGKRKLSAKEILSDIRSGMDAVGLKKKYGLSDKSLESVLGKLSAAGALAKEDMLRLKPVPETIQASPTKTASASQWRCPACNAPQPQEMSECPSCGVIVAKFAAHQSLGNPGSTASPTYTRHDVNVSGAAGGWTYVVWSIVALAAVGAGIIGWSMHRSGEKAALEKLRPESSQEVASLPEEISSQEESASIAYPPSVMESFKNLSADGTSTGDAAQTTSAESKPSVEPKPPAASTKYATGMLRQFNSSNFKAEVVEASKTYPVLFQFYSDT